MSEDENVAGGIVEESVGRWERRAEADCIRTPVKGVDVELDGKIKAGMGDSVQSKTYLQR